MDNFTEDGILNEMVVTTNVIPEKNICNISIVSRFGIIASIENDIPEDVKEMMIDSYKHRLLDDIRQGSNSQRISRLNECIKESVKNKDKTEALNSIINFLQDIGLPGETLSDLYDLHITNMMEYYPYCV